ncbi:hypothetical protein SDC9_117662 [bioreactor metagenome]|uniref:Uncharacterized protein n=1 Tax=bioreactor metagenome TaxID=1076179 RepID=A0A645C8H8_9ZZZZ
MSRNGVLRADKRVVLDLQECLIAGSGCAEIRLHIRAGHMHREHRGRRDSARRACLRTRGFVQCILRGDFQFVQIQCAVRCIRARAKERRSVRDRSDDVHAEHAHTDPRADARRAAGSFAIFVGGVCGSIKFHIGFRADRQIVVRVGLRAVEGDICRVIDACFCLGGSYVNGDRASDADIGVGIPRLRGCRGRNRRLFGSRNGANANRACIDIAALDGCVIRMLDHRYGDTYANARGLPGRGGRIRPDREVGRNQDLCRSFRNRKGKLAVRLLCGVAGCAVRAFLDRD